MFWRLTLLETPEPPVNEKFSMALVPGRSPMRSCTSVPFSCVKDGVDAFCCVGGYVETRDTGHAGEEGNEV